MRYVLTVEGFYTDTFESRDAAVRAGKAQGVYYTVRLLEDNPNDPVDDEGFFLKDRD